MSSSVNRTTDDSQETVIGLTEQNYEVSSSRNILNEESVRVYVDYDSRNLPESPGEGWTRFICMSDTHGRGCFVPPGDVLLHAGDVSHRGTADELKLMVGMYGPIPFHPPCWSRGLKIAPGHRLVGRVATSNQNVFAI